MGAGQSGLIGAVLTGEGVWAPELSGQVAIVTGAGRMRSIGRSIAVELARQGVKLVLTGTGRSPGTFPEDEQAIGWQDIESVAEEIQGQGGEALTAICDVTSPENVERVVSQATERFGRLDILVNNAGASRGDDRRPVVDLDFDSWRRVIDVNLTGAYLMARAAARFMVAQGEGGAIVNISSIAARLSGAGAAAYSASKAGLNALSRSLAMELAPSKIRVNAILPGLIATSRMDELHRNAQWQATIDRIPLRNAGEGSDIANLCIFLASDKGHWITGQEIAVDGGVTWR